MMIIYETRSAAENKTLESLRLLIYSTLFFSLIIYSRIPYSSVIFITAFLFFSFTIYYIIKSLIIQKFRLRLRAPDWRINIQEGTFKRGYSIFTHHFKNIKVFYYPEEKNYVEFFINQKYYCIWKKLIDEQRDLFDDFIASLSENSIKLDTKIVRPARKEVTLKTVLYTLLPLSTIYIMTMTYIEAINNYLLAKNLRVIVYIIIYTIIYNVSKKMLITSKLNSQIKERS